MHKDFASRQLTKRGFLVGAGSLALAGCGGTPARRVRKRITLVVDTPEGRVSGSSVIEDSVIFQDTWLGGLSGHSFLGGITGEALVIDLGGRGLLFQLLRGDAARKGSGPPGGWDNFVFPVLYE